MGNQNLKVIFVNLALFSISIVHSSFDIIFGCSTKISFTTVSNRAISIGLLKKMNLDVSYSIFTYADIKIILSSGLIIKREFFNYI
jgi:hypothetical protein